MCRCVQKTAPTQNSLSQFPDCYPMAEEGIVELALKQTRGLLQAEDILVEAIKDMVKHKLHVLGCAGKAGECA